MTYQPGKIPTTNSSLPTGLLPLRLTGTLQLHVASQLHRLAHISATTRQCRISQATYTPRTYEAICGRTTAPDSPDLHVLAVGYTVEKGAARRGCAECKSAILTSRCLGTKPNLSTPEKKKAHGNQSSDGLKPQGPGKRSTAD